MTPAKAHAAATAATTSHRHSAASATTRHGTATTGRAAVGRHAAAPMMMMTEITTVRVLAVAVPKVIDARRSVIAGTWGIHVASVLVFVVPSRLGDHRTLFAASFFYAADIVQAGHGRSRSGGRCWCGSSVLTHAVGPGKCRGEDLSSRGGCPLRGFRLRRTPGLGPVGQARDRDEGGRSNENPVFHIHTPIARKLLSGCRWDWVAFRVVGGTQDFAGWPMV